MLIYANSTSAPAAPGTGMCGTPSLTTGKAGVTAMATGVATTGIAVEQAFWQRKPFAFPAANATHHNSMDLGTVGAAGSAVRTDAGRPPRGVPR